MSASVCFAPCVRAPPPYPHTKPSGSIGIKRQSVYMLLSGGHLKLVLGNPGTPNDWCWPNQNTTNDSTESATAENLLGDCSGSPVLENVALPGDDLMSTAASNWSACCAQCSALAGCNAWTWHAVPTGDKLRCWLKHKSAGSAQQPCTPGSAPGSTDQLSSDDSTAPTCVSWSAGSIPPAGSDPMPDPAHLTCHFNGAVPVNTTGAILFDLAQDPREATNLAALRPSDVNTLRALLDQYIASAVVPLNELPAERQIDPAATETAVCFTETIWVCYLVDSLFDL